jgi:hypothetical protein
VKILAACILTFVALTGRVEAGARPLSRTPLPENAERQIYPAGTRVLIIGLSQYADRTWPALKGQRDAERVQRMFIDRGLSPRSITMAAPVPGSEPSLEEIIVRFGEQLPPDAKADARVVVYIAGHGYSTDGSGYLVTPDAPDPSENPTEFKLKAIPVTTLLSRVAAFHAAHVLLILDACFSGLALESMPRERFPHPPPSRDEARVLQVITAGSAGQTVADDGRFAELIVSGLVGAADLNFDGWISGTELGMYLRLRMTEISGGRQIPTFGNIILGHELTEGENWFASAQLPLQAASRPTDSRDLSSAAFRDCEECPLLRVVPAPRDLSGTDESYLAMGIREVTLDEYDACFRAGACAHWAWTESGSRGSLPVTDVNREDVHAYTHWLTCLTGDRYRLPSDAEWMAAAESERERFARSSTDTPASANCRDCGGASSGRSSLPAGSFTPSEFGLYDLVGNVWEWVDDCGENAAQDHRCLRGLVRGGAFTTRKSVAITLPEGRLLATTRDRNIGFRVVRDLGGTTPNALVSCAGKEQR